MAFYCREDELRKMNRRYAEDKFECIVIYGRRRVGKTVLINEFCKDKRTIYYLALNATSQENLEALSKAIYQCNRPNDDIYPVYASFGAALEEIGRTEKRKERYLLLMNTRILPKQQRLFRQDCSI
mgnify:CR=1 FL=1